MAITQPDRHRETISAVEFGLRGVPVVAKNAGGPIDVVESGASGILFDDERELPEAVVRLLTDKNC